MARKAYGQKKVTITFSDGGNEILFFDFANIEWEVVPQGSYLGLNVIIRVETLFFAQKLKLIFANKVNSHSPFKYTQKHKIIRRNYCSGVITLYSPKFFLVILCPSSTVIDLL